MRAYAGIEEKNIPLEEAAILLQSIPYDGTSTWGKGADRGFEIFLDATEIMEIYDIETDSEVHLKGVHLLDPITESSSPEAVYEKVKTKTRSLLELNKFLTFFGGEHSISIGIIEEFANKYQDLTVLQLDAHADLRPTYHESPYNHACALHASSKRDNLIQVGIRSMDRSEKQYLNKDKVFFAEEMYGATDWMDNSISKMGENVYITLDLDVLDPSIMPATGTPEPGGLDWNTTLIYLKKVFQNKNVVGFDIVEFAPIETLNAASFLVAKLYYKMLSYKFNQDAK